MTAGFREACASLANQIAGDEIAVGFAVLLDFDGQPRLWVLNRTGKAAPFDRYRLGSHPKATGVEPPWTRADLDEAAKYLNRLAMEIRCGESPSEAHARATHHLQRLRESTIERELRKAADIRVYPWVCACKRRFSTKGGRTRHINASQYGTHGASEGPT